MSNKEIHEHEKTYSIIVNGRPRTVTEHSQTYLQIVRLAFPDAQLAENIVYTITYSHRHEGHDGSLVDGQTVKIKDGMIFNVTRTDKS